SGFITAVKVSLVMPAYVGYLWRRSEQLMNLAWPIPGYSAIATAKQAGQESSRSLDPGNPGADFRRLCRPESAHQTVLQVTVGEVEIPTKIFLTRLVITFSAHVLEPGDHPCAEVVTEATGIDEVLSRFSGIELVRFERNNSSHDRIH